MVKTQDIDCVGYAVKADIYEGSKNGPVLLSLIGRTSRRTKQRYFDFLPKLARDLGITTVIFDYTGHGDSPFDIENMRQAQQFLEVVTVFDWMQEQFPGRKTFVVGSSYGGFMGATLTQHRHIDGLILRAPAMYRPEDFYTLKKNEDQAATMRLRHDAAALSKHPLLEGLKSFKGEALLMVHGKDDVIPTETTNAYAAALKPEVALVKDATHSLDQMDQAAIAAYNQIMFDWLQARC
jgi:pimeloyl-ACP methyl ester carboxylesterase